MLVCITGKIGSGKSIVLNQYKKLGYKTLEMDSYIHSIYKPSKIGFELIKKNFGLEYVNDKGVDRKKLGQLVFKSKEMLNKLNAITLPLIKNKILYFKKQKGIIFIELGIYITNQRYFNNCFDLVILVKGKKQTTNQKLSKLAWKGNKSLVNWDVRLAKKDNIFVLDNASSINQLKTNVKKSINFIKNYSKKIVE